MMLLIFVSCLIATLTSGSVYLSNRAALEHLERMGFLSKYVKDITLEFGERSAGNLTMPMYATLDPNEILFFSRSLIREELNNSKTVLNYLNDFGYLDGYTSLRDVPDSAALSMISTKDLQGALILFQSINSMAQTGRVDDEVLAKMKIPRCGVPDLDPKDSGYKTYQGMETFELNDIKPSRNVMETHAIYRGSNGNSLNNHSANKDLKNNFIALDKRYETTREKWVGNKLTFYFENFSDTLEQHSYTEIINAFEVWTSSIELFLYEVTDIRIADVRIKFVSRDHGDRYPFDGPIGVLAHAFYPPNGEIHFDNDEEFTRFSYRGVNLRSTAIHEFGHTLGLRHSMERDSLMSPYHAEYKREINLQEDDLAGISRLFKLGKGAVYTADMLEAKEYQKVSMKKFDNPQDNQPFAGNSSCIERIDAVIKHPYAQTLFVFAKDLYYKIESDKLGDLVVAEGYPKHISVCWDGLEDNIDAAYVNVSISAAFFFKGGKYWKYDFINNTMYPGFPREISPDVPGNLRATMIMENTVYFFTEDKIVTQNMTNDSIKTITDKKFDVDAAFPLLANGYFGTTQGSRYSVYSSKDMEAVRVYHGRPLSWDYGLPMCVDDSQSRNLNPKMKPLCDAYALLAFTDANLDIPQECYSLLRQFPVIPPEEITGYYQSLE